MRRAGFIKGMFDWFSDRNFFSTDECINDRAESDSGQVRKCTGGGDWQVTAKAGLSYQFDLRNTGATTYRDFAGESTVYNGKDGRMLANIGIDTRIKDNTRIGLTIEKSAFGRYNVDNAINANIRYTF